MKQFTRIFNILSITTVFLVSCKKESSTIARTDIAAFLRGKNWKLTAATVSPARRGVTDLYNTTYPSCQKDDINELRAANIFVLDNGAAKCDPADPQTQTGTWSYDGLYSFLYFTITGGGMNTFLNSIETNGNTFSGTSSETDATGLSYTTTWVFTQQ